MNIREKIEGIIYRWQYYKRMKDSRHVGIPCEQWVRDDRGRPIGKNGKPRWMNGATAQLVPNIVYPFLEKNHGELLSQVHEYSQGELVDENFDNNSAIYTFVLRGTKEAKKFVKQNQKLVQSILIPFDFEGEIYQIQVELEIRPEARLC